MTSSRRESAVPRWKRKLIGFHFFGTFEHTMSLTSQFVAYLMTQYGRLLFLAWFPSLCITIENQHSSRTLHLRNPPNESAYNFVHRICAKVARTILDSHHTPNATEAQRQYQLLLASEMIQDEINCHRKRRTPCHCTSFTCSLCLSPKPECQRVKLSHDEICSLCITSYQARGETHIHDQPLIGHMNAFHSKNLYFIRFYLQKVLRSLDWMHWFSLDSLEVMTKITQCCDKSFKQFLYHDMVAQNGDSVACFAIRGNQLQMLREVLYCCDQPQEFVNRPNFSGFTAIHALLKATPSLEIVSLLLSYGGECTKSFSPHFRQSALTLAIKETNVKLVSALTQTDSVGQQITCKVYSKAIQLMDMSISEAKAISSLLLRIVFQNQKHFMEQESKKFFRQIRNLNKRIQELENKTNTDGDTETDTDTDSNTTETDDQNETIASVIEPEENYISHESGVKKRRFTSIQSRHTDQNVAEPLKVPASQPPSKKIRTNSMCAVVTLPPIREETEKETEGETTKEA